MRENDELFIDVFGRLKRRIQSPLRMPLEPLMILLVDVAV